MVGLSDIPCVGKAVDKISDATVEAFFRGLRYMFCYKHLVDVLNSEIEKVNIEEVRVSSKTVAARADGKIIYDHVLKWQTDMEEFHESSKKFTEIYNTRRSWRCIPRLPIPNPVTRFRIGREAVQKTNRVIDLIVSGTNLLADEIAYLPPVENIPETTTLFQNFQSRKDAYGKLWESLVREGSSTIHGIYGMPGVGKTRMMEQLWVEAVEKKIFDKVTRADVGSDTLDVVKLQNQIAGHLGCHFESQNDKRHRANQLKNSLINGGRILVILDDVWREIPLNTIGIPYGDNSTSKGCKILLTSRDEAVCLINKCKHPVNITILTVDEALQMFRNIVGTDLIDSLGDDTLVQEVCKKCAGLPLLIHAVGKALQFMSTHSLWENALYNLDKGNFENIAGIDPQAYACIKLSIDRLPDYAKACLFLCSLFPEDDNIDIKMLITLATGSQLIPDRESSIRAMVDILKSSSLLLEGEYDEHVKLHDIIRDVASSVAFRDPKYAFLQVRCGSRLPDNADYSTRKLLCLDVKSDDVRFPEDPVCPTLHSMWLRCNNLPQFSDGFFIMFLNLGFLVLQHVRFFPEQFSLQRLGKLRELFLDHCDIREKDLSLLPENLKSLCIRNCDLPRLLDLPSLKNLLKLEIHGRNDGSDEVVFVPNTISNLSSLEDLHIPKGFSYLDDASDRSAHDEICSLTRLTSLEIHLSDLDPCQGTTLFSNLLAYKICVGVPDYYDVNRGASSVSTTRLIEVHDYHSECLEGLMVRAEELKLRCSDVDVSSICNRNREAFADLKNLYVRECNTMEHLARISQHEMQHRRQPWASFGKLTILQIKDCSAMKYLFCNSVAKCLEQLQELSIDRCLVMELIVMNEGTSDVDIINFSKLKSLELSYIPMLTGFYGKKKDNSAIPSVQFQPLFDGLVAFPSLKELKLYYMQNMSNIWGKHYCNDDHVSSSFCKLKRLEVSQCDKLEIVIPLPMLHRLPNLEYLTIGLCGGLSNVFVPSIARDLTLLKEMYVYRCDVMREIIGAEGEQEEITAGIVFPELNVLQLDALPDLTSFWCRQSEEANTYKVGFPNLVKLELINCGGFNLEAIELGIDDSTCQLKSLSVSCTKEMQLPSKWQLRLPNLENFTLREYRWWDELKFVCFKKVMMLSLGVSGCSTLFDVSVLESLQQLQVLEITGCDLLEQIVEDLNGGDSAASCIDKTITLSQLNTITFAYLPNLKCFSSTASYAFNMPKLDRVRVSSCPQLETFTSLETSTGLVSVETMFHSSYVKISNLNDFIREYRRGSDIFDNPGYSGLFPKPFSQWRPKLTYEHYDYYEALLKKAASGKWTYKNLDDFTALLSDFEKTYMPKIKYNF